MKLSKASSKRSLFLLATIPIVIVICIVLTVYFVSKTSTRKPATPLRTNEAVASSSVRSLPIRIKISKIHIDAAIDPMGLTSTGDMEAPSGPKTVGWYKFGPYPGEVGNAVIDGHFGPWKDGEGSVFDNLSKLKSGDSISVITESGVENVFVVRELRTFDKNANTSEVFGKGNGQAHLNIITCTGSWNKNQKAYSSRLVVFADKV